jgi:hypothetical protein
MNKWKDIFGRIAALFVSSALGIITGSAIIAPELEVWKSAALAGFVAVAGVVEKLAKASIDGKLTKEEIDNAFALRDTAPSKARKKS